MPHFYIGNDTHRAQLMTSDPAVILGWLIEWVPKLTTGPMGGHLTLEVMPWLLDNRPDGTAVFDWPPAQHQAGLWMLHGQEIDELREFLQRLVDQRPAPSGGS